MFVVGDINKRDVSWSIALVIAAQWPVQWIMTMAMTITVVVKEHWMMMLVKVRGRCHCAPCDVVNTVA